MQGRLVAFKQLNDLDIRLVLKDVGLVGEVKYHLSGIASLYCPHGAGKTAVARALPTVSRLLGRGAVERRGPKRLSVAGLSGV